MLKDRLKNFQENDPKTRPKKPSSDDPKNQILLDIQKSQTRKKCLKISKVLDPQPSDENMEQDSDYIDMDKLRNLTWTGIPQTEPQHRCDAWKLLLDYMPIDRGFRSEMLTRKREEY